MYHKVTFRRLADNYLHEAVFDEIDTALEEAKFSRIIRGPTEVVVTDELGNERLRRVRHPF